MTIIVYTLGAVALGGIIVAGLWVILTAATMIIKPPPGPKDD